MSINLFYSNLNLIQPIRQRRVYLHCCMIDGKLFGSDWPLVRICSKFKFWKTNNINAWSKVTNPNKLHQSKALVTVRADSTENCQNSISLPSLKVYFCTEKSLKTTNSFIQIYFSTHSAKKKICKKSQKAHFGARSAGSILRHYRDNHL